MSSYYRFKDGDILVNAKGEELKVMNVGLAEAGIYKCRASSAAGKTFSKSARLIVSGEYDRHFYEPLGDVHKVRCFHHILNVMLRKRVFKP